jgi:hypothetical protein
MRPRVPSHFYDPREQAALRLHVIVNDGGHRFVPAAEELAKWQLDMTSEFVQVFVIER